MAFENVAHYSALVREWSIEFTHIGTCTTRGRIATYAVELRVFSLFYLPQWDFGFLSFSPAKIPSTHGLCPILLFQKQYMVNCGNSLWTVAAREGVITAWR